MELQAGSSLRQAANADAPRVSTIFVRALIEAVEAAGVPVDKFLEAAGVSTPQFATAYGWVDAVEADRLTHHAVELARDPAFGLHWPERSPLMKFDLLAMTTAYAPTLGEALAGLTRFQPILWERPELEVIERADGVLLRLVPLATTELALRVRTEVGVSCLVRLMRHVGAPDSAVRRISFAHRAPPYLQEYTRIFAGRARFGEPYSGIEIDPACLHRPLHSANVELHQQLTIQAEQVLTRVQTEVGHAGQVREYLRRVFPRLPEMREAARTLGLSERSLRRRLLEEGSSYTTILQESQQRLASQLLLDPKRSIKQVGYEVGFTSTAGFHRAFKRWTGASPAVFRSTSLDLDASVERAEIRATTRTPQSRA